MKRLAATLVLLSLGLTGYGQCQRQPVVADTLQAAVMTRYIAECRQQGYFSDPQGIVQLVAYHDGRGQLNWVLSAVADDRYRDNPPPAYDVFGETVLLVYPADSAGHRPSLTAAQRTVRNACLQTLLADRNVPRRPQPQLVDVPGPNGTTRRIRAHTLQYGNSWNSKRVIFGPDGGTYRVLKGV